MFEAAADLNAEMGMQPPPEVQAAIDALIDFIAVNGGVAPVEPGIAFLKAIDQSPSDTFDPIIHQAIAEIDDRVGRTVDAILHHPAFRRLEANWRGLWHVVSQVDFAENTKVVFWHFPKSRFERDLLSLSDVSHSAFFEELYGGDFGQFGGEPYAAVYADFEVTPADLQLVRPMAAVAAAAHAPIFFAVSPLFLGLSTHPELQAASELSATFDTPAMQDWAAFREAEDSRYLAFLLPRMLLRTPHTATSPEAAKSFMYEERIDGPEAYLWGSPTFAFAVRLAKSFAKYRTTIGLLATSDDPAPAVEHYTVLGDHFKPPVEVVLGPSRVNELATLGLTALTCTQHERRTEPGGDAEKPKLRFSSAPSFHAPKKHPRDDAATEYGALLGAMLPYLMVLCRVAHYVKVIQRETLGKVRSRDEVQEMLNAWLSRYVRNADELSDEEKAIYPFSYAEVETYPGEDNAGWFPMKLLIQPRTRYLGRETVLSLLGRLGNRRHEEE